MLGDPSTGVLLGKSRRSQETYKELGAIVTGFRLRFRFSRQCCINPNSESQMKDFAARYELLKCIFIAFSAFDAQHQPYSRLLELCTSSGRE